MEIMKKSLVYLMLGVMMLFVNQKAIAEESVDRIYHFIFKSDKNIPDDENETIFKSFIIKTDMLEIDRCNIKRDGNLFVVTFKTKIKPEDIIAKIQVDKFSTPLMLVTYFVCDVADKKDFLSTDSPPSLK